MIQALFGGASALGAIFNIASMVFPAMQLFNAAFNLLQQAVGQAIKMAMDQLMKNSGLPKFIADAVKGLVDQVFGGNNRSSTQGATQAAQDQYGGQLDKFVQNLVKSIVQDIKEAKEEQERANGGSGGGSKGWLRALAEAFGKIADKAAKELETMGKNLNKDNPSEMIEYQAATQEFSLMMQTFTNAIKTIGEANVNTVRKS